MTVLHTPTAGDGGRPAADQPQETGTAKTAMAEPKPEQVVLVLREPGTGGYLVYTLSEDAPTQDGGAPFRLKAVPCPQAELPDALLELVLDRDSLPPRHLRSPRRAHVVVSTHAGLRLAPDFHRHALRPLLAAIGLEPGDPAAENRYRVTTTTSPHTVRDVARQLGRDGTAHETTLILLSGDGGMVDVLNGLGDAAAPPTVALLPLGTGNALFHSLHKPLYTPPAPAAAGPSPLVLALRTLLRGTPAPLPTFAAAFSPGARLISGPAEGGDEQQRGATQTHAEIQTQAQRQTRAGSGNASGRGNESNSETESETDTQTSTQDHQTSTPIRRLVGAIVASYGFHASLVWASDTPAYRAHGARRFGMAAEQLLREAHAYEADVLARKSGAGTGTGEGPEGSGLVPLRFGQDPEQGREAGQNKGNGEVEKPAGKLTYLVTTLVSSLEKTFTVSPHGRPLDGQLRVVGFLNSGEAAGERTMAAMEAAYRGGEHVGMAGVVYEAVDEVRVGMREADARWRKVCVDGSIVEVARGGWMAVKREEGKERVRVLVDASVLGG